MLLVGGTTRGLPGSFARVVPARPGVICVPSFATPSERMPQRDGSAVRVDEAVIVREAQAPYQTPPVGFAERAFNAQIFRDRGRRVKTVSPVAAQEQLAKRQRARNSHAHLSSNDAASGTILVVVLRAAPKRRC